MIFIWTPNAWPFQYLGLALFLVQLLSNFIYPTNSGSMSAYFMESSPLMRLAFAGLHLLGLAFSPGMRESFSESYITLLQDSSEFIPIIIAMAVITTIVLVLILYPVTITMDYEYDNMEQQQQQLLQGQQLQQSPQYHDVTDASLFNSSIAIECLSFLVYFSIMCAFFLFMHLNWRRLLDDDFYAMSDSNRDENAMESITAKVRSMPIEEFVSEEDVKTISSVSEIKKMLNMRGKKNNVDHCLERSELIEELEKCRKYDDTCCICATAYEKGDPLRIWPQCGHQFHVECIDQWAYTFSSRRRNDHTPTCPLCKEPLK